MKRAQSILEYLIVLTAIVAGILISTVGFKKGIDKSLEYLEDENRKNVENLDNQQENLINNYKDILNNHYNEWNNNIQGNE